MKISSSFVVPAPPEQVFAALVDPDVLRRSIPGCEELRLVGDDVYEARVKVGVAGMKGTYTGKAELREKRPPESLTISFDGRGAAGFVRGSAAVRLTPAEEGCRTDSEADVQVGGVLASVGSRLVEAAARKLAGEFFKRFADAVNSARV